MVKITLDLVRKRAEHNEGELSTLEEISLHQLDIEAIDCLHRWCPKLKILLLQGNIISKIEKLSRLRDLVYLNLALNNLEEISGLERCESLTKLDLTANFIINLESIRCLQGLSNLKELFLVGNPCSNYRNYRAYVLIHLPYLDELDGRDVTKAEILKSKQIINETLQTVREDQAVANERRRKQKKIYESSKSAVDSMINDEECDTAEKMDRWNQQITEHTPESRIDHQKMIQKRRERAERHHTQDELGPKKEVRYFTSDGRPLNLNKANLDFEFKDEWDRYLITVDTYKYIDPELIACDLEPSYVRIIVNGHPLQLVFPTEVQVHKSTVVRSLTSGKLVVTAIKVKEDRYLMLSPKKGKKTIKPKDNVTNSRTNPYLEFENFTEKLKICEEETEKIKKEVERPDSPGFQDNISVPPLE